MKHQSIFSLYYTVTLDQVNAPLLNKRIIYFFKKNLTDPNIFNSSVACTYSYPFNYPKSKTIR